jgi:hypothetical protein
MKPEGNWKLPQEPTKSRLPPVAYRKSQHHTHSIYETRGFAYIILRVHVEHSKSLNPTTIRVLADRSNILDPNAGAVVGLEHDAVGDEEVVVDCLFAVRRLERASPLGVAQVGQVDDVGDWNAVGDDALHLVELVVQEDELVPVALGPLSLVGVCGSGVLEAAEHFGVGFVGRVPDGDGIFVVGDADVAAIVAAVGAVVADCCYCLASVICKTRFDCNSSVCDRTIVTTKPMG